MKQRFPIILVVLSLFVALATVAAAPMASGIVRLVGVQYVPNKGPVFTFEISENFSKSALKGTLQVQGGGSYTLHCTKVNETTVKCNASQKVAVVNVSVTFGGSTFWTYVPGAPEAAESEEAESEGYCYSIWDWWDFTDNQWTDFGPHCQDEPAEPGDEITYTVPDPTGGYESYPVEFYEEDVSSYCEPLVPYYGPAYYFPGCPEGSAN